MIDERFYRIEGPLSVRALFPDAEIEGDEAFAVAGPASLEEAGPEHLAYREGKPGEGMIATRAGALVLRRQDAALAPPGCVRVIAAHPRAAFGRAARALVAERSFQEAGAPPVDPSARIERGARLGPGVVVGPGAEIGSGTEIGPNAVIGPGVTIGRGCRIGPNVSLVCALVGDGVTVLAGASIGQTGFGVAADPEGLVDLPHFGRVILEDRVTLGACVTVDRGMFADTVVAEDAKIDNLSQIAHNVVIGRGVIIAAFGGISGSVRIGDGAILGGRVGLADHVTIGPGAVLAGGSGVVGHVPAGERWGGYPARAMRRWLRETSWLSRAAGRRDAGV